MKFTRRVAAVAAAAPMAAGALSAPAALADEAPAAQATVSTTKASDADITKYSNGTVPKWRKMVAKAEELTDGRVKEYSAYSPSMDRNVPLVVVKAKSADAPTYYLLNGAGGGDQKSHDWVANTNVLGYFLNQDVNLVIPMGGKFSYYVDWLEQPGGSLQGEQKWETFLTKELPGPLEAELGANGRRAISGMSMSATSSLLLAQHNPGFYDAVGSFSGCAETSTPMGFSFAGVTLNRAGTTPEKMWGPMGSPTNVYNDALVNAEKLRGTALYISNGSGLVGETDTASYLNSKSNNPAAAAVGSSVLAVEGGAIEGATNVCTHNLEAKLNHLDIPATYNFSNVGTHTWTYWNNDLQNSWQQVIAPALGIEPAA